MAEERDPQVSRRYRELGSEEPPRSLDQAILAASRRSAAPRRRWYVPLAAAAVALLGIGIALQVEREQPDSAIVTAPSEAPSEPKQESAPAPSLEEKEGTPRELMRDAPAERRESRVEDNSPQAGAAASAPRAAPVPQTAPARNAAQADAFQESPERFLERIAELRKKGRHDEADKALAEFRQRYPSYSIPEAMLGTVERKQR